MAHSGTALVDPFQVFAKINLSAGMRVADFGCGRTGHFVFPLAFKVGQDGIVYAIDILKDVLQSIRSVAVSQGYDNIKTVWSDIERVGKTPIPPQSLDVVFFVNVLFQLKNRQQAIDEATRLLKSSGFLVIIDWRKNLGPLGPVQDEQVDSQQLANSATDSGLELNCNEQVGDYHFLLIFKKL